MQKMQLSKYPFVWDVRDGVTSSYFLVVIAGIT